MVVGEEGHVLVLWLLVRMGMSSAVVVGEEGHVLVLWLLVRIVLWLLVRMGMSLCCGCW